MDSRTLHTPRSEGHPYKVDGPLVSSHTARLVLADLLRESDDPDDQTRGRFLRAGVTLHSRYKQGESKDPRYLTTRTELLTLSRTQDVL